MRRTLIVVSGIVCLETLLFTALAPLLPHLADRFNLSKAENGMLTAIYGLGTLLAAIPSGLLSARLGAKVTAIVGLVLLSSASVAFGVAASAPMLFGARMIQGIGAALAWTGGLAWLVAVAPRARRAELIGLAVAAAMAGALLGPVVGIAATSFGSGVVFSSLAGFAAILLVITSATPGTPVEDGQGFVSLLGAVRERRILGCTWLIALAGVLLGLLSVLAPLELVRLGWTAAGAGVVFLVTAAAETLFQPVVGRWSDRRGRRAPLFVGLLLSAFAVAALPWGREKWTYAALVLLAGVALSLTWAPAMAALSDASEEYGLGFGIGFGLMNVAWAPGQVVGSAIGGFLAQVTSDSVPLLVASGICVVTIAALAREPRSQG